MFQEANVRDEMIAYLLTRFTQSREGCQFGKEASQARDFITSSRASLGLKSHG